MIDSGQIIPPLPPHIPQSLNQVYELILWRKSLVHSQDIVRQILLFLGEVDESLRAKYIYQEDFEASPEQIADAIQKGANDMPELGSCFTLTTALDSSTFSYRFLVGVSNPMLCNVFGMRIPKSKLEGDNPVLTFPTLQLIFKGLIKIFDPSWGASSNALNLQRFNQVAKHIDCFKIPSATHWFNYFDQNILDNLEEGKVFTAPFYLVERLQTKGAIAILQQSPFNDTDSEHLQRQQQVMQFLNFDALYRRYSRSQ